MTYSLIDYFRAFSQNCYRAQLQAPAIATYMAILEKFNNARFPTTLIIATAELMYSSGIDVKQTFMNARNALKSYGLIDFKTKRGVGYAVYTLLPPVGNCPRYSRPTNKNPKTETETTRTQEVVNYDD